MKGPPVTLFFSPFAQFLGPAAVEGHASIAKREFKLGSRLAQVGQHGRHVDGAAGKQRFEGATFLRGFRVKRKPRPAQIDLEFLKQSFNTPGTEIAPGSDVVRENFKDRR